MVDQPAERSASRGSRRTPAAERSASGDSRRTPPAERSASGGSRRTPAAERRRERESRLIAATRQLFDERGVRDAQIEDVARAVGVNRAIIYRHFTGKEELFALTEVTYLEDLQARMIEVDDPASDPVSRLRALTEVFIDFGLEHPAFIDCGMTILQMGPALLDELSSAALFRLGRGMSDCLRLVVGVIETGQKQGVFAIEDADQVANTLYALGLGGMQLARLGVMVREGAPGIPTVTSLDATRIKEHLVASSLALVHVEN